MNSILQIIYHTRGFQDACVNELKNGTDEKETGNEEGKMKRMETLEALVDTSRKMDINTVGRTTLEPLSALKSIKYKFDPDDQYDAF